MLKRRGIATRSAGLKLRRLCKPQGAQLAAQFQQNVLDDATDAFALYFDDADELAGLTEEALANVRRRRLGEGKRL